MSKVVKLRNVNPLGFVDVPILGRQGEAPSLAHCAECGTSEQPTDHEHTEIVGEDNGQPGSGCLVPGEEFETTPEIAERLLEQVGNFELVGPKSSTTEKKG